MRFKSTDLVGELNRAHPHARALAFYLDDYAKQTLGKDLMVTDVERTKEEYARIYGQDPYTGPMPHLGPPSHAVDFRASELTSGEIDVLCAHMNKYWPRPDGKPTLMCHDVGHGMHFHLQALV